MSDASARKLQKIVRNGDEWQISHVQGTRENKFKDTEAPQPDLAKEMEGLLQYALEAAPYIAAKYHANTVVSGVAFDWKGDDNRRNAVIFLTINAGAHGFIKVPTPKKLADSNLDEKKKGRWDTNAVAQFDKLEEQALAYIDGARAQPGLGLTGGPAPKKGKKASNDAGNSEAEAA